MSKNELLSSVTGPLWERIGIYPHHGMDIFLPALRSKKSSGIGEFFDLLPLIEMGQTAALVPGGSTPSQLSPLN